MMLPIEYRDFYDLPRIFVAKGTEAWYVFDCPFDEQQDDYRESYSVYVLSEPSRVSLSGSWIALPQAGRWIGDIPVALVKFDPTLRAAIDSSALDGLGD